MSMYLPNPGLHPTGAEPAEFIEVTPSDLGAVPAPPDPPAAAAEDDQDEGVDSEIA